jgi:nucleoside-diphosphate-sugar epimerase
MTDTMRILVTGGAGFIGSHIVDRCVAEGHEVRVLDDLSNSRLTNLEEHIRKEAIEFVKGDIRDPKIVKNSIRDVDVVFHEAAQVSVPLSMVDPSHTDDVNVRGTLSLLAAASDEKVERFVYASSSSVYGDPKKLPVVEDSPFQPLSPYAASKIACEAYCMSLCRARGLPTICLRYFNVFGPRQKSNGYASVIPTFIRSLLYHKPMTIFGDGSQTRDFVHVNDVAEANMLVLTADAAVREPINIGSGKAVSIAELASILREIGPAESPVPIHAPERKGDVRHSVADITKAEEILRYAPSTDLRSDLKALFKLYEEQLGNKKR